MQGEIQMGYISNLLIDKTEQVLNILPVDSHISAKDYDALFDKVHDFIMNGGDRIHDTAHVIARDYVKQENMK